MPEKESLAYLEDQLSTQIAGFDSSRQFFRRQQFRFAMGTAVLSALVTVLIATEKIIGWKYLSLFTLVCSAAITVMAAYDQFLRSRELWVQKTDTWMELQNLAAHISYAKVRAENLSQDEIDDFYKRFDQIIMGEHKAWKKVRSTDISKTPSTINGKGD